MSLYGRTYINGAHDRLEQFIGTMETRRSKKIDSIRNRGTLWPPKSPECWNHDEKGL